MNGMQRGRARFLVELLGAVAGAAFWTADNGEDDGSEGISVQRSDMDKLSKALDACDELPELPGNVVRDGWLRALDELRALLDAPSINPRPFGYWLTPKTCAGLAMFQRELIEDPVLTASVVEYFHVTPLYDAPATQPPGEPVAVMYADGSVLTKAECGIAFDTCCKVGTPLYAEQHAPVSLSQVLKAYEYASTHPDGYLRGTTNWCAAVAHALNAQRAKP